MKKKLQALVQACRSYYIAHVGLVIAGGAYGAAHFGMLVKLFHGNQDLANTVSGYCELAGFLATVTPNVANHINDATGSSN